MLINGRFRLYSIFIIGLLLFSFSFNVKSDETFYWVDDNSFAPYIYSNEKSQPQGLFHEIVNEAFLRLGINYKLNLYPWARAQQMLKVGKADGMVTIATSERLKSFVASNAIFTESLKVFYVKDNVNKEKIKNISSLSELDQFSMVSYLGNGWAKENLQHVSVTWAPSYSNAIQMLAVNRADIFLGLKHSVLFNINKLTQSSLKIKSRLNKIISTNLVLTKMPYSLLIRKDSKFANIIPQFNNVITEMKYDGTLDKIVEGFLEKNQV